MNLFLEIDGDGGVNVPLKDLSYSTTIREKLVKIGAKVVSHGRYITFQMAEVAVPRDLFRKILRLIDRLRRPSLAAV